MGSLGLLPRRVKYILQTEGLMPLFRRVLLVSVGQFFGYGTYYLYEHNTKARNEADFLPRIQGFAFKIVTTNQQADELASAGLDFSVQSLNTRQRLEKGAVAFCFFMNGELAHIGWMAMNEEAKNIIDPFPYQVDFAHKQGCTGGTWTNPKYRGKGLMVYGYFKRFEFLREKGFKSSRNAVAVGNTASQKAHAKFSPKVYARARYLRILRWTSWKETPIIGIPPG
jgi:hypothetical protein